MSPCRGKAQREQPLALLFHEVTFPTPPSHGAAGAAGSGAAAGLPRPERALLRLNLTRGERPLPRPLPTGHTIGLPRATRSCSRPSAACHRGGEGRDSPLGPGRGTGPRPPAGLPRPPLPGCAPPSPALPARHGGAPPAGAGLWRRGLRGETRGETRGSAGRSGSSPSEPRRAAETPPRPGPAAARAPGAWAGAAAPGDSGQHPPSRPRAYFSYKGKEILNNEAADWDRLPPFSRWRGDPAAPGHGSCPCPAAKAAAGLPGSRFAPPGRKHFGSYYEPGGERGNADGSVSSRSR